MHYAPSVYLSLASQQIRVFSREVVGDEERPEGRSILLLGSPLPRGFVFKSTPYLEEIRIHSVAQKMDETDVVARHIGSR